MVTELQISTSPRATWVWAPDDATAERVRALTGGRTATRGRERLRLVVDVDLGADALDACQRLAAAGFTFTWHADEPVLNRTNWPCQLPGMPTP